MPFLFVYHGAKPIVDVLGQWRICILLPLEVSMTYLLLFKWVRLKVMQRFGLAHFNGDDLPLRLSVCSLHFDHFVPCFDDNSIVAVVVGEIVTSGEARCGLSRLCGLYNLSALGSISRCRFHALLVAVLSDNLNELRTLSLLFMRFMVLAPDSSVNDSAGSGSFASEREDASVTPASRSNWLLSSEIGPVIEDDLDIDYARFLLIQKCWR